MKMKNIKNKILIMSGKGGVGKTTISVNLAYLLAEKKFNTGLLDVDIHGPNVPKMLNLKNKDIKVESNKLIPIKFNEYLKVISMGFILNENEAAIWRGPMKHNVINQFVNDVEWNKLDYLIIDFPPGTGDEAISISQLINNINGAIIVSSPQEVSQLDALKAINFCKKVNIPILGLIENMSGEIFGKNNLNKLSKLENIEILGSIELNKEIRKSGDSGIPFKSYDPNIKKEFEQIRDKIILKTKSLQR